MFLTDALVANTNRYVKNGPEDRTPVFKRTPAGIVHVRGAILRYSTTSKGA
jgi:hypothetical protein